MKNSNTHTTISTALLDTERHLRIIQKELIKIKQEKIEEAQKEVRELKNINSRLREKLSAEKIKTKTK